MPYSKETKEKYAPLIIEYIQNNPNATYREIEKEIGKKVSSIFDGGMKEAFHRAKVSLSKPLLKRSKEEQKRIVIEYIINNPHAKIPEILKNIRVSVPRVFGSIEKAYEKAGVVYKTTKKAQGTSIPSIRKRAESFEKEVLDYLGGKGKVKRKVFVKKGRKWADGSLKIKNKTFVIEVKNYTKKRVTLSDVKQTIYYMNELNYKEALIITSYNFNEIREYLMENKKIYVIPFDLIKNDSNNNKEIVLMKKMYKRKI